MSALSELTAIEAARQIRAGIISSRDLVSACITRIGETDGDIGAWRHFDADKALADAAARDELRRHGGAIGALHGIPVGVKDIIDTDDMLTELGSPIHRGRAPQANAAVVDKLLEAGAVIMGKTATTEFAFMQPADTANPHNLARTHPAARPVVRPPRWRRGRCRSPSAARPMVRPSARRRSAVCSASSRPGA